MRRPFSFSGMLHRLMRRRSISRGGRSRNWYEPAAVDQQRPVLFEQRQRLGQVQRRRLDGRVGALGHLAHLLDEAAGVLGILQQQADDVGVDRVDGRVQHQIQDLLDRQRGRDRLADLVDGQRVLEADVLVLQPLAVQAALHDVDDLLDLEGLEDVVVGAPLHRLDGRLDRAEPRHDDGQHRDALFEDALDQLEAAHVGHLQVRDHQVVAAPVQLLDGLRAVLDGVDHVAFHGQEVGQDLADDLLVVDDQDPRGLQLRDVVRPLRFRALRNGLGSCGGHAGQQGFSVARAQEFPERSA